MCGIVSVISETDRRPDSELVYKMLHRLRHRGDQPPRVVSAGRAVLGSARLAIVGGEGGSQPFTDGAGSLWVLFNGEIYNHRELRSELEAQGCHFLTTSDTEVLLHGYRVWGRNLPGHLKGMYAFLIWDEKGEEFFVARDPFGIKPLYYAHADGQWAFSSEIRPLSDNGFSHIKDLRPGAHILNGRISERVLTPGRAPAAIGEEVAKQQFLRLFRQSVSRHMNTNLPVAVFCSGGIDSSAVLYEAVQARQGNKPPVIAYCVGTDVSEDLRYARGLAAALGVEFRHVPIEEASMVRSIGKAIEIIESFEPNHIRTGTTSVALASAVHKDGIKVALVGEGADELLGGYEEFPDAIRRQLPEAEVEALFQRFISELHKTQLQRVDRTTMAFGIEARVPFLDSDLASFIISLPLSLKLRPTPGGRVITKYILRESYRGILPDAIVERRKIPMGQGAGVGDNGEHGPFYKYTNNVVADGELKRLQQKYSAFDIKNKEEAFYFTMYQRRFGSLDLARHRPKTNVMETK